VSALSVAAGVPPAVEGWRPAARIERVPSTVAGPGKSDPPLNNRAKVPPGGTPRLYGRRDARRYVLCP
jgi:hypothetical protein